MDRYYNLQTFRVDYPHKNAIAMNHSYFDTNITCLSFFFRVFLCYGHSPVMLPLHFLQKKNVLFLLVEMVIEEDKPEIENEKGFNVCALKSLENT